jgi:3-carboxy-cis,cis-muconate cycloisomerase
MTDLLWPGDDRAGALMSDAAFLAAMVLVENAWLRVLIEAGVARVAAAADLRETGVRP